MRRTRSATWNDLLAVGPHMTAELIDGGLFTQPRPAARHNRLSKRILRALGPEDPDDDDLPGWVILPETELHLGEPDPRSLVLVPDISGWRLDRAPDVEHAVAVEIVPDWVCEILSPGTARHDRLVKMDRYASLGVAWAKDPDPRSPVAARRSRIPQLRRFVGHVRLHAPSSLLAGKRAITAPLGPI